MRDFRIVLLILGALLCGLGALAGLFFLWSTNISDGEAPGFLLTLTLTGFVGGLFLILGRSASGELNFRQAVCVTVASWLGLPLFAALPFMYGDHSLSFTDAVFETVSGMTTTGSTVMTDLETTARTLLMWRALIQWIGGIGIIALSLAILPFLKVGGMQLFQLESSDNSTDRLIARPKNLALVIGSIYAGLTLLCAFCYILAGMMPFDALAHALTTVATGGYSTRDASMGAFSPGAHWVGSVFMLAGALPFMAYVRLIRVRRWGRTGGFSEIRWFFTLIAVFSILMIGAQLNAGIGFHEAVREGIFNVIAVITTTGYASGDYQLWGSFAMASFFVLTFLGGCAGSTAGGFKTFRLEIMGKAIGRALSKLPSPHSTVTARYQNRRLTNEDVASVALFAALYVAVFAFSAMVLAAMGLDFMSAISAAATALANVGPGLGDIIGPAGNFVMIPDAAKWVLCAVMILGRLEIIVALLLFTPRFYA